MRYLGMIIVLVLGLGLVFLLAVNLEGLKQVLSLRVGLPFIPLGILALPVWLALLATFAAGFIAAVILDLAAWHESNRTIVMQRKQIRTLQDRIGNTSPGTHPAA